MEHFQHSVLKTSRKLLKKLNSKKFRRLRSPILLLITGILLIVFGGYNYYKIRTLSFTKAPPTATLQGSTLKGALPVQITIPSIKIDEPVDTGMIKDGVWQISYNHPTFLDSSARPGEGGNVVIYGHNKKVIFGNLPYLSLGQKILIKTADGKIHTYEVYKKEFVKPDRVDLVSPTDHEELTIYTCWGLFDSQRVVVKAKPVL